MIIACMFHDSLEFCEITASNSNLLKDAIWIDLLYPTSEEEKLVESHIGIGIPTKDEMVEIELSSRFYKIKDTLFMTAAVIAQSESEEPKLEPITFLLTEAKLVTIRYIEPQSFKLFTAQVKNLDKNNQNIQSIFIEFLDVSIDRLADILELVGRRIDELSKNIFAENTKKTSSAISSQLYKHTMRQIGINGDLIAKARESLMTFSRMITFLMQLNKAKFTNSESMRVTTITKDILSLSDHANFVSGKLTFLLDAFLGLINIEQNGIIKIFSVASVMFLPPTLIASVYGMNFHLMPELSWKYGYAFALSLMLLSAWLPYKYFRRRKWL